MMKEINRSVTNSLSFILPSNKPHSIPAGKMSKVCSQQNKISGDVFFLQCLVD